VEAALAIIDAEGVDALTIRHLGEKLGTGSATLYWHIGGKEELFDLVYDRIMGELTPPEPDPSRWQEQLKEFAREAFRVMRSHNDAARLSLGRVGVGPNMLRLMESLVGLLRGAGIPDHLAGYFGDLMGRYLDASVLEEVNVSPGGGIDATQGGASAEMLRDYFSQLPADQFPNLVALAATMTEPNGDERFELGLDILINGLAACAARSGRTGP
jgi:AcrR family transcriptional regulator